MAQGGDEGEGLPVSVGRIGLQPLSLRPPTSQGCHVGLHPGMASPPFGSSMNTRRDRLIRPW
jgi:hypothetical protein